jgi:hypothetical protein
MTQDLEQRRLQAVETMTALIGDAFTMTVSKGSTRFVTSWPLPSQHGTPVRENKVVEAIEMNGFQITERVVDEERGSVRYDALPAEGVLAVILRVGGNDEVFSMMITAERGIIHVPVQIAHTQDHLILAKEGDRILLTNLHRSRIDQNGQLRGRTLDRITGFRNLTLEEL